MAEKAISKEKMLEQLQEQFQEAWFDDADYFYKYSTSAIITGKSASIAGKPAYTTEHPNPEGYVHDVNSHLDEYLHQCGWEAQPYDNNTLLLVPKQ